ncbi:energy transducer TonB [Paraflavitalea pollutisoli]|uniref:energy transducer TonB n=1 Tax=Paraflavitalea pollutisoli TaxID=3034143 RepID=UPI0023EDE490|nr:energy transducer TonB [Paraflavitalea sp. H1-2-19X]
MARLYTVIILFFSLPVAAQKKQPDTVRKYLTSDLHFTTRANMDFPALAIRQPEDRWLLVSAYRDTNVLLRAWFRDEALTIKEGPFVLYHPKRIKAIEGTYIDNVRQGLWKAWHPNGQLKDSGAILNNYLVGRWYSWNDSGKLQSITSYLHPDSIPGLIVAEFDPKDKFRSIMAGDKTTSILDGPTITFHSDGSPKDSGQYVKESKEGIWKTWNKGGTPESMGTYVHNSPQGEWEYYHPNGQRSTREVYANGKVVKLDCYDEQGNFTGNACPIQKPPVAQGRFLDFEKYMLDNIFWPTELKRSDIQGDVTVTFTISATGEMKDFRIIRSPHEAMSREVTEFFKKQKWSPAVSHNRLIEFTVKYNIPFYR